MIIDDFILFWQEEDVILGASNRKIYAKRTSGSLNTSDNVNFGRGDK